MSSNLFHRVWCVTAHRRLKNITVLLEWIPRTKSLKIINSVETEGVYPQSQTALESLQQSFKMLNVNSTGTLDFTEFCEFLKTLRIPVASEPAFRQLFQKVDNDKDMRISFEELKGMMLRQLYNELHQDRYYVAVSLEEAECIRGIIHAQNHAGQSVVPNIDLSIGLRILSGDVLLDGSMGFQVAPPMQQATAIQCFRFINSELYFTKQDVSILLHALHFNSPEQKQTFFNEVRSCRRRVQKDWKETLVEPVLSGVDEYQFLEFHAMITGIRNRIHKKGMRFLDAFRAFDFNRDGLLSCSEFYGGLEWLGLTVSANDVYRLVRYIDTHKDGRIRFTDFETSLAAEEEAEVVNTQANEEVEFKQVIIQPKNIPEIYVNKEMERVEKKSEISIEALKKIKVKVKNVTSWKLVWTSEGTGATTELSIWSMVAPKAHFIKRNKYTVDLGHYAAIGFGKKRSNQPPSSLKGFTIELTDMGISMVYKSQNLDEAHVNYLCPYPVAFKMVWWHQSGTNSVCILPHNTEADTYQMCGDQFHTARILYQWG